jgi:hypothetical protein
MRYSYELQEFMREMTTCMNLESHKCPHDTKGAVGKYDCLMEARDM